MKKSIILSIVCFFSLMIANAQKTALDFEGEDCNGNMHHLFEDLDAGKAVLLHLYMSNCGSCPPPAQKIQTMANNILANYPGLIKAYAFPHENIVSCSYSQTWVNSNGLSLYVPMDSGQAQAAYYEFGMPTVILLGGKDHRVMLNIQNFSTRDTTRIRDSILSLIAPTSVNIIQSHLASVKVFPNPATDQIQLELNNLQVQSLKIDVINLLGQSVATIHEGKTVTGKLNKTFPTTALSAGIYFIRIQAEQKTENYKFVVNH